jgi:hypothetical protein
VLPAPAVSKDGGAAKFWVRGPACLSRQFP